jgi:glycerol-3-phosphate cytidylyltransferase-like family protein
VQLHPDPDQIALTVLVTVCTLVASWLLYGRRLVVGVNDDESIKACKGTAPVLNDDERIGAVKGCRWVDEVVPHCPYVMSSEYLSMVIEKYKIDYVVHGDDPCIVDGKDVYQDAKDRGLYRSIPRTTGVSTTDIVGRMLVMSRDHHDRARQSPVMGSLISKEKARRKTASVDNGDAAAQSMSNGKKSPPPPESSSPVLVPCVCVCVCVCARALCADPALPPPPATTSPVTRTIPPRTLCAAPSSSRRAA